jgi:hypothetical protein
MMIVERISDAFLTVLSWFKKPELLQPDPEDYIEAIPKTKKEICFPETLGELLEGLENTFKSYAVPALSESWLDSNERIGLKKLGAHVLHGDWMRFHKEKSRICVEEYKKAPTLMFINTAIGNTVRQEDRLYPDFMFAIKLNKLPWNVVQEDGVPYKFGFAYYDTKTKKHFWAYAWITVRQDRSVSICKMRTTDKVRITKGASKGLHYTKAVVREPDMLQDDKPIEQTKIIMMNAFVGMFDWWVKRSDKWHVSVKKNGDRVTFSIPKEQTKKYFADRDKTIKTASGKAQKIVHYVEGFDRVVKGKTQHVKAHIRGVDTFSWKGYACFVKAPEFHSLASVEFDIAPIEESEEDDYKDGLICISKVGLIIANYEDRNERIRKTA